MNTPSYLNFNTVQWQTLKELPNETFWIIFLGLSIVLIIAFYRAYKATVKARTLEDTPTSKIRSAAQGWVELEGIQHFFAGLPLIAPLSKMPCTWYYYTIEQYKKDRWVQIESSSSQALLVLEDSTGECVIDPKGAKINTNIIDSWGGFKTHPNGKPKSWIGRLLGSFGHYRYREYRMSDGTPLYAIGHFRTLLLTDAPENISAIYKPSTGNTINLLTKEASDVRRPYVLSSYTQKSTISKIKQESRFYTVAFLAFFIVLTVLLVARLS